MRPEDRFTTLIAHFDGYCQATGNTRHGHRTGKEFPNPLTGEDTRKSLGRRAALAHHPQRSPAALSPELQEGESLGRYELLLEEG
jgi:hypothetical protein